MKETAILTTYGKGKFWVFDMLKSGDVVLIALPNRVTITVYRRAEAEVVVECDLGLTSSESDLCPVALIDLSKSCITISDDFKSRARPFDQEPCVKSFVLARERWAELMAKGKTYMGDDANPGAFFGGTKESSNGWQSQAYIHFEEHPPSRNNIEFSVFRSDDELLAEPIFTLCGSVKLGGKRAHYFFFVVWQGDEFWSYRKNFFFCQA